MNLFELPAKDKGIIFNDFPIVSVLIQGESVPIQVRALPAFIGMTDDTDGVEIGADDRKITFDYDDATVKAKQLSEGDQVSIVNPDGVNEDYRIKKIARDATLGLWYCDLRRLKAEATAGIVTRRSE